MAEGKKNRNDSMGKVLLVLVFVLLMVSMVSTYLIFTLSSVAPTANPSEGSGEVRLTVLPRSSQPPETGGGVVSLDILPAG